MNLADLIAGTAAALDMPPVDLATILSYETAGTFDPMKRGPVTQWGQHQGLIQFGQPQARQYGADFSSPQAALSSQLGPDGAVARYFRDNGWRPGMGMLDAYSIVNAGAPGRYNASDANNGGAPGTVRDKVEGQMAEHRAKAERLLGGAATPAGNTLSFGSGVPTMADAGGAPTGAGLAALFDPRALGGLGFDMGVPMGGQQDTRRMAAREEERDRRDDERERRRSLADLIRY